MLHLRNVIPTGMPVDGMRGNPSDYVRYIPGVIRSIRQILTASYCPRGGPSTPTPSFTWLIICLVIGGVTPLTRVSFLLVILSVG